MKFSVACNHFNEELAIMSKYLKCQNAFSFLSTTLIIMNWESQDINSMLSYIFLGIICLEINLFYIDAYYATLQLF